MVRIQPKTTLNVRAWKRSEERIGTTLTYSLGALSASGVLYASV